ncbi:MAG: ATP-binding cassette domain-containing protein, partial [Gammaproteobacteria bacterium]|nr:ATP-binding cassette domain-containing protein [Gammaproteobacteria bacterium]
MLDAVAVLDFEKVNVGLTSLLPLEIEALCYQMGERSLIDRLDLRIEAGPVTVVMGANGAGKSLFLRLVHGILTPSSGRIT